MNPEKLPTAILDSFGFVVTCVDPEGTILFVNRLAARNLSGTRDTLIGTSLYDYFPEQAAATRERIRQTVTRRTEQRFEAVVTLPDGTERNFDSVYYPTFDGEDGEGEVVAVEIVAWDVTEHHRRPGLVLREDDELWGVVSDDLSMTAQRLRAIVEAAPLIITVHDPDTTVRFVNRVIEGESVDEVIGTTPLDWLPDHEKPVFQAAFDRVLETGEITHCEVAGLSGHVWLVRLAPLSHEGRVGQVLGCVLDVSEQRRLQEQLSQKQKIESLGTMARGIGHDFNNLLTAVMGNSGLARRRLQKGREAHDLLDEIDVAARRAADLCEQMMVYAGAEHVRGEPASLNEVINEITSLTRAGVNGTIELEYALTDDLPLTRCSRAQLGQIVLNLVNNAAEAIGDQPGRIRIANRKLHVTTGAFDFRPEPPVPGHYVELQVTDTGPGVRSEERRLIFDPFYSTKTAGHGLGLPVIVGILSVEGGAIRVDATDDGGARMTVLFPVHSGPLPESSKERESADWESASGVVLVVDDERSVRTLAVAVLTDAGYDTLHASNGDEALAIIESHGDSIRAVLLDVTMPVRDGMSTLMVLRETRPKLPVLLSSGREVALDPDDRFASYLPKPYDPDALVEAIAAALR
jgi:PAS domain S-box-containing protein